MTRIADTTREIDAAQLQRLRAMTPSDRAQIVLELVRATEALAVSGIRLRHPDADEGEIAMRLGVLRNGPELMRLAFGWDDAAEGN